MLRAVRGVELPVAEAAPRGELVEGVLRQHAAVLQPVVQRRPPNSHLAPHGGEQPVVDARGRRAGDLHRRRVALRRRAVDVHAGDEARRARLAAAAAAEDVQPVRGLVAQVLGALRPALELQAVVDAALVPQVAPRRAAALRVVLPARKEPRRRAADGDGQHAEQPQVDARATLGLRRALPRPVVRGLLAAAALGVLLRHLVLLVPRRPALQAPRGSPCSPELLPTERTSLWIFSL